MILEQRVKVKVIGGGGINPFCNNHVIFLIPFLSPGQFSTLFYSVIENRNEENLSCRIGRFHLHVLLLHLVSTNILSSES